MLNKLKNFTMSDTKEENKPKTTIKVDMDSFKVFKGFKSVCEVIESHKIHFPDGSYHDMTEALYKFEEELNFEMFRSVLIWAGLQDAVNHLHQAGAMEGAQRVMAPSQLEHLNKAISNLIAFANHYGIKPKP